MKRSYANLLGLARRLPAGVPPDRIARGVLIVIFALVAIYYLLERDQSFTIHAQTGAASIEVTGARSHIWVLGNAVLCNRRPGQIDGPHGDGPCDNRYFETFKAEEAEISLPAGTKLSLHGTNPEQLAIQISKVPERLPLFDSIPITENSVLFFDRGSLADTSSLVISGYLTLGEIAETGATQLVRQGSYEIRESLARTSGISIVAMGDFLPGDYVRVEGQDGKLVPMRILITVPGVELADFDVIATSPPRPSSIVVQRIGAAQTRITSRWMDRLSNDALPLALSIFLGLLGAALGIAKSLFGDSGHRKPSPPPEQ